MELIFVKYTFIFT